MIFATAAAQALFPGSPLSQIHRYITNNINSLRLKLKRKNKLEAIEKKGRQEMEDVPFCPAETSSSSDDEDPDE